jgi:type IV secretory pathway VirB2 component (pilin)
MNATLNPGAPNAFAAAVQWLDGTLLGTLASSVAVIAVASVGVLLLSGRVDVRRSAQVIFGCFILFGASSIATGIMNAVNGTGRAVEVEAARLPPPDYPSVSARAPLPATPYDPYAGAAMPSRR